MNAQLKQYVKALVSELEAGLDFGDAIKNLKKLLKQQKHETLFYRILEKSHKILSQKSNQSLPTITLASLKDEKLYSPKFKSKAIPTIKIDPSIIGGYIASENFEQTDQSYKSKLLNWYQSATKSN